VATVLILAREEVVAALLGLLVELRGYQPVYAHRGETAAEACARLRCDKMVIDCDHWECSEEALGTLKKAGVKLVLFSPSRGPADMRRASGSLGIQSFTLPIGPDAFGKLLG
jgi:hypothetical protein